MHDINQLSFWECTEPISRIKKPRQPRKRYENNVVQLSLLGETVPESHVKPHNTDLCYEDDVHALRDEITLLSILTLVEAITEAFGKDTTLSQEAWDWILRFDEQHQFSFIRCCFRLQYEPAQVRETLLYCKRKNMPAPNFKNSVRRILKERTA